jgi:hypothetical protein
VLVPVAGGVFLSPPINMEPGYALAENRAAAVRPVVDFEALAAASFLRLSAARMALHFFACLPKCTANEKVCPHPGGLHTNIAQGDVTALLSCAVIKCLSREKLKDFAPNLMYWVQLLC